MRRYGGLLSGAADGGQMPWPGPGTGPRPTGAGWCRLGKSEINFITILHWVKVSASCCGDLLTYPWREHGCLRDSRQQLSGADIICYIPGGWCRLHTARNQEEMWSKSHSLDLSTISCPNNKGFQKDVVWIILNLKWHKFTLNMSWKWFNFNWTVLQRKV